MKNNLILKFLVPALLIKLFFFIFLLINAPQGRFLNDSNDYLQTAAVLSSQGAFAFQDDTGALRFDILRTPGYPVFLAILNGLVKIPINGVVVIQIFLTLLTALITYKSALEIDQRIAFLSAVIILYDPAISIFSLMILTETLFIFLLSLFMLFFIRYLKYKKLSMLVFAALSVAMATYVKPIGYYLGIPAAIFIVIANLRGSIKKSFVHMVVFVLVLYSILGIWQVRNYKICKMPVFSRVINENWGGHSLFNSYARNKDTLSKGKTPFGYYAEITSRSFLSLMTRPGSFKYFRSPILSIIGKILAYPWMIFWLLGFFIGISKIKRSIHYQFLLCIVVYFIFASIIILTLATGERYRLPMMPFLAIISALGWSSLSNKESKNEDTCYPKR